MIKVVDAVRDIVYASDIAIEALSGGILNLSAYAKKIKPEIEKKTHKSVKLGTIVVALSRLQFDIKENKPLIPNVVIDNIAAKSGLVEITFNKTRENKAKLQRLYEDKLLAQADFFTVTQGIAEICIVVPEQLTKSVLNLYKNEKPKVIIPNLASLTIRFDEKYLQEPNVMFSLLKHLAIKRINILELVSTCTELTFLLHESNLQAAFTAISARHKSWS